MHAPSNAAPCCSVQFITYNNPNPKTNSKSKTTMHRKVQGSSADRIIDLPCILLAGAALNWEHVLQAPAGRCNVVVCNLGQHMRKPCRFDEAQMEALAKWHEGCTSRGVWLSTCRVMPYPFSWGVGSYKHEVGYFEQRYVMGSLTTLLCTTSPWTLRSPRN